MTKPLDLIGKTFGLLTVINKVESRNGKTHWNCQCSCGNFRIAQGTKLTDGTIKHCGCLNGIRPEKEENCLFCGIKLKTHQSKYCSRKCQTDFQQKKYIEDWKNGLEDGMRGEYQLSQHINHYIHEKYNEQCSQCGWHEINPYTGSIPLEIEHIDGNYTNNKEDNLILLCPNCHSLTATYKGANKGNGRAGRQKYS
jgi:hypothetical protein